MIDKENELEDTLDSTEDDSAVKSILKSEISSSLSDYEFFRRTALNHPVLSLEEEAELGRRLLAGRKEDASDIEKEDALIAKQELVSHNMRLVDSIAQSYRNSGYPMMDLIQAACGGLVKAVDSFDYTQARFSTYATRGIKNAINDFRNANRFIRIPADKQRILKRIQEENAAFSAQNGRELTDEELAERLGGIDEEEIALLKSLPFGVGTLSDPLSKDEDEGAEVLDTVASDSLSPEEEAEREDRSKLLGEYIDRLPEKERYIILSCFGLGGKTMKNLNELALELGISAERVRQIKEAGLASLRRMMEEDNADETI